MGLAYCCSDTLTYIHIRAGRAAGDVGGVGLLLLRYLDLYTHTIGQGGGGRGRGWPTAAPIP